jgi:hypothetical protein
MRELIDFWRESCLIDGPVYDLGADCYGCRHPAHFHAAGSPWSAPCKCCLKAANAPTDDAQEGK